MKYNNPLATHKDIESKRHAFLTAGRNGEKAIDQEGREHLLRDLNMDDVEYIGGRWRVQNKFEYNIQVARGEEFVVLEKINRIEKNRFEFYRAAAIGINCYGRWFIPGQERILAKYETDDETFWAYGKTIPEVRAFLGISLYDKYADLIHSVACKNKNHAK